MARNFLVRPFPNAVSVQYTWDGEKWRVTVVSGGGGGSGGSVTISDTPPASPHAGDLWWESDTGNEYIFFNDGSSSQWVATSIGSGGGGGGTSRTVIGDASTVILPTAHVVATSVAFTAPRIWTLPLANSVSPGYEITIDDTVGAAVSATNTLTISRSGSDLLHPGGSTTTVISVVGCVLRLISDGTSKWAIAYQSGDYTIFTNKRAGGVLRLANAKMADVFSVMDFNATGNNSPASAAQNDAAFAAAVAAAIAKGGAEIRVPAGVYYVSAEIAVNADNVQFRGDGPGITTIKTTSITANIFSFGDPAATTMRFRVGVSNMGFGTNVTKTAGAAVKFTFVQDYWFEDWFTDGMFESGRFLTCTLGYIAHGYAINTVPTVGRGIYVGIAPGKPGRRERSLYQ